MTSIRTVAVLLIVFFGGQRGHLGNCEVLPPSCESVVYCQGELLHTVQMAKLDDDSKQFVDRSLVHDVETTMKNFYKMMDTADHHPTRSEVQKFVDDNFLKEDELEHWRPDDFVEEPPFLATIPNEEIRHFAKHIVSIWADLGRKVKTSVAQNPDQHSLIYVPNGFIIPGGRFREYYYWDSYWITQGLLISGMNNTVRGMIDNFLSIIDKYGHIPNGGRVYYAQRSQPPLLTHMARKYYEQTKNITWLKSNIEALTKETMFWMRNRIATLNVDGKEYQVASHNAKSLGPRPESYYEDVMAAEMYETEDEKNRLYVDLKSAAESGWDFSSRWIFDSNGDTVGNISYTKITRVAPVDLNSFLYGAFDNMAFFNSELKNPEEEVYWKQKASELNRTINELLWDEEDGTWYDFDILTQKRRRHFAATNLTPLWVKAYNTEEDSANKLIHRIVAYLRKEGIADYLGGIPATTVKTGEQWDLPNAWPCVQSIVVDGLGDSGVKEGQDLARMFAERWIAANMIGFNETGSMYEKYDAEHPGKYGGGGEYVVQKGFGWTNGVALELINKYMTVHQCK